MTRLLPGGVDHRVVSGVSAREEQEWIASALRQPVTRPAVRVWTYRSAAVVLGCSGRPTPDISQRALAADMDLCIRPTGGGAVLVGPWLLGTSVVLPPPHPLVVPSLVDSYRWFGLAHVAWLNGLGICVRAGPVPRPTPGPALPWACFASLSHWEVGTAGRKIVGTAQCRRRNGVLFSSAVLIAPPPWELMCEVLGHSRADTAILAERTACYSELVGRLEAAEALAPSLLSHLIAAVSEAAASSPLGAA
ncbi:MAG: ligase [Burkholderiales bacterium]|nr:ligase [Burkholderiales bacterium]